MVEKPTYVCGNPTIAGQMTLGAAPPA